MSAAFLLTSLVIVALPGTGALYTITAGLAGGRRRALVAAAGCTLGIVPHLAAATTGAAALLRASGLAFEVFKYAGVAYLAWMAVTTWRDRSPLTSPTEAPARSTWRTVGSAVGVNLLNPKLTIFFFAFLPQFAPAGPHLLARMLGLSAVFMVMTFVVFVGYGLCASALSRHLLTRPRVVIRLRRAFAASFLALSAKLATTAR